MNFWEFKEDHSRGYYLPTSNKAARDHGGQLVTGIFFLVATLFKLAWRILAGIFSLPFMLVRWMRNLRKH